MKHFITITILSQIIASKATGQNPPVILVEGVSFMYIKHKDLFLVAATQGNPNAAMLFEYLFQKIRIMKAYLGEKFTDETLHANFTLIYELMDETMDYGYPQNCTVDVLKLYINQGDVRQNLQALQTGAQLTSQITGAIDWRREGIRYRSNEVYIDVQETITLLASTTGTVLRGEIAGRVMMKTLLTGMPECKFGLNDKLIMEKEGAAAGGTAGGQQNAGVEIDDCTFHRCVFGCLAHVQSLFYNNKFNLYYTTIVDILLNKCSLCLICWVHNVPFVDV